MAAGVGEAAARQAAAAVARGLSPEEGLGWLVRGMADAFGALPRALARKVGRFASAGFLPSLLDRDTLKGVLMLLQMSASATYEEIQARSRGEYDVDEFGLDPGYLERIRPLMRFMYRTWWRVRASGLGNLPDAGRALLVANHAGVIAWDGAMVATSVLEEHPAARLPRALHLEWFVRTPFAASFLQRTGQVMACPENGERLLSRDHLVTVFPEGAKGAGKLFRHRYQLARFGRGGFVRMALKCGAPIVPVSIVGSEEIHPMLAKADSLARVLGLPYFPVTPTFPLLGPLGFLPLPSKWLIHFDEPLDLGKLGPDAADDFHTVSQISEDVRGRIQGRVDELRRRRGGVFF